MGLKKLQWAKMGLNWSKLATLVKMSQNGPKYVIGTYWKMEADYPKQCIRQIGNIAHQNILKF